MSPKSKAGLFISGFVLRTSLFFGFTLLAAVFLLGNRETPKEALVSANAYERFGQAIIDDSKEQSKNDPNAIPLDDPQIAAIFKASLSPKLLLPISESVIDAGYDWLEGKDETLTFTVDLSKNKEILASGISTYAIERVSTLPICTDVPSVTNIFKIPCRPANLNLAAEREEIYQTLLKDTSVFPNSVLTADNLPKNSEGVGFVETYKNAPTYYKLFRFSPWIVLSIAFAAAFFVVSSSRTKMRGLRTVATALIGTGIILAIAPIVYSFILPSIGFSLPGSGGGNDSIAAISNDVMSGLYKDFNTMLINISIQVAACGLILFFVIKFFSPRSSPYKGISKKAGIAVSVNVPQRKKTTKISADSVPIQTSENHRKVRRNPSKLEKSFVICRNKR